MVIFNRYVEFPESISINLPVLSHYNPIIIPIKTILHHSFPMVSHGFLMMFPFSYGFSYGLMHRPMGCRLSAEVCALKSSVLDSDATEEDRRAGRIDGEVTLYIYICVYIYIVMYIYNYIHICVCVCLSIYIYAYR